MELPIKRYLIAPVLVILGLAGCAATRPAATGAAPAATQQAAAAPAPAPAPAPEPPPTTAPAPTPRPAAAPAPTASASEPGKHAAFPAATAPAAAAPPRRTAPPAAAAQATPPAAPAAAPAPKPLNLSELEQRLRDTHAIGVFTKLSLKNQVDDLLGAFRDLYRDPKKRPSAELRQRYDGLLLKVLGLLQEGDAPLAAAIASSREAIWSILADPDKFSKI